MTIATITRPTFHKKFNQGLTTGKSHRQAQQHGEQRLKTTRPRVRARVAVAVCLLTEEISFQDRDPHLIFI